MLIKLKTTKHINVSFVSWLDQKTDGESNFLQNLGHVASSFIYRDNALPTASRLYGSPYN